MTAMARAFAMGAPNHQGVAAGQDAQAPALMAGTRRMIRASSHPASARRVPGNGLYAAVRSVGARASPGWRMSGAERDLEVAVAVVLGLGHAPGIHVELDARV
jgi:hypothetical protein